MKPKLFIAVLIVASGVGSVVRAQDACELSESLRQCYMRITALDVAKEAKSVAKDQKAEVANAQTGASSGGAATASSATPPRTVAR